MGTDDKASDGVARAVRVRLAARAERRLIEGLLQFYIYDFSELEPAGSSRFEFDEHGGFPPFPGLDEYWGREGFYPLLICVDDRPVGFALVNTHSHHGGDVERNMGEFFVARKHRHHGVAGEAVRQVLEQYPGRWEVAVAARNLAARKFWPKAIAAVPTVTQLVQGEGDGEQWCGPIWSFVAAEHSVRRRDRG